MYNSATGVKRRLKQFHNKSVAEINANPNFQHPMTPGHLIGADALQFLDFKRKYSLPNSTTRRWSKDITKVEKKIIKKKPRFEKLGAALTDKAPRTWPRLVLELRSTRVYDILQRTCQYITEIQNKVSNFDYEHVVDSSIATLLFALLALKASTGPELLVEIEPAIVNAIFHPTCRCEKKQIVLLPTLKEALGHDVATNQIKLAFNGRSGITIKKRIHWLVCVG